MQVTRESNDPNSVGDLVDHRLELNDNEVRQVTRVVEIALRCVDNEPAPRPPMDFVLQYLDGRAEMTDWTRRPTEPSDAENTDAHSDAHSDEGEEMRTFRRASTS
jgi:hypothetical protein